MIEVLHYETVNSNSKVIGYVDIHLPKWGMKIRKIAHFQDGNKKWFNLPAFKRKNPDGVEKYVRYWELDLEAHNGQLLEHLTEAVKKYCFENKIPEVQPVNFNASPVNFESDFPF